MSDAHPKLLPFMPDFRKHRTETNTKSDQARTSACFLKLYLYCIHCDRAFRGPSLPAESLVPEQNLDEPRRDCDRRGTPKSVPKGPPKIAPRFNAGS
jgi:hypothetical protein